MSSVHDMICLGLPPAPRQIAASGVPQLRNCSAGQGSCVSKHPQAAFTQRSLRFARAMFQDGPHAFHASGYVTIYSGHHRTHIFAPSAATASWRSTPSSEHIASSFRQANRWGSDCLSYTPCIGSAHPIVQHIFQEHHSGLTNDVDGWFLGLS